MGRKFHGGSGLVRVNKTYNSSTLRHTKAMNRMSLNAVNLEEIILWNALTKQVMDGMVNISRLGIQKQNIVGTGMDTT